MKTINLRAQMKAFTSLPSYLPHSNTLTDEDAQEIAERFGDYLPDLQRELSQAREAGLEVLMRPDTRGDGLGMYHNAYKLFFGYVYDLHYTAACDSEAAIRQDS